MANFEFPELLKGASINPALGLWAAAMATYVTKDLPLALFKRIRSLVTTSLEVTSNEDEFLALARWVERKGFTKRFRSLRARNREISAGFGRHFFFYKFRLCWFHRFRVEGKTEIDMEEIYIRYIGRDQNFLRLLAAEAVSEGDLKEHTRIYTPRWSSWSLVSVQPKREMQSIILAAENRQALTNHIERFFRSEKWYREHGVPYRTGICLHGPPGTGKTSLVRAICSTYNLDLYTLDITNTNDQAIKEIIWRVGKRSVLLIEDIDTIEVSKARGGKKRPPNDEKLTLGGLLNAIDGVIDSDGRLLIMTTNHIEKLDPALLRTGRIDLKLEMGFMTAEMFQCAFKRFFPEFEIPTSPNWLSSLSPADFQRYLLENQNDPCTIFKLVTNGDPLLSLSQIGANVFPITQPIVADSEAVQ